MLSRLIFGVLRLAVMRSTKKRSRLEVVLGRQP